MATQPETKPVAASFDALTFKPRRNLPGIQATAFFPNGYGASVIKGYGSYGDEEGLYELAVALGTEDDWQICYSTPLTDDVIGHLSPEEVTETLANIAALPPVSAA